MTKIFSCIGCINYKPDPENNFLLSFYCEPQNKREMFPGKGCVDYVPVDPERTPYDHIKYCKKHNITLKE